MNTNSSRLLKFGLAPLIIGISSGFATSIAVHFVSELNLLVGLFFGIGVIFLILFTYEDYSAGLITALLASSVVAYYAAIWGTLFIQGRAGLILGYGTRFTEPFGPVMFSIAGFLGALVFNLAVLLLLSPKRGLGILGKAAAGSLAGAFLGFLSAESADSVGAAVKAVIGVPARGLAHHYVSLYSAYLIWQKGDVFADFIHVPYKFCRRIRTSGSRNTLPGWIDHPWQAVFRLHSSHSSGFRFLHSSRLLSHMDVPAQSGPR